MGIKKISSLKAAFWKFLFLLIIGLTGAFIVPFCLTLLGTSLGFITYADSSERYVKSLEPIIASTPHLTDIQLPNGTKYLILDKNYQLIDTSLEGEDLERATKYAVSGKINQNLNKQYLFITRPDEYVIIQYYIGSQFTNNWLNKHFPSPEFLLYILMGTNCIIVCIALTTKFAKNLRSQLTPLFEATVQIAEQNLDFEVGHSTIKEFEDVLISFADMKENLKCSLQKQWNAEQQQKQQIAALAHDLKTPLTIIQGNIDLITETRLDEEQKIYSEYIAESSEQMLLYIKTLIALSQTAAGYELHMEEITVEDYIQDLKTKIHSLCMTKEISLELSTGSNLNSIKGDKMMLERAIMNVINNGLEYSPQCGTIYVSVCNINNFLQISVIDEGKGFSQQALSHAKEQFFMDDHSRSSNMHYGMGLYIATTIIKQHRGTLLISNSEETNGAHVLMKIPY